MSILLRKAPFRALLVVTLCLAAAAIAQEPRNELTIGLIPEMNVFEQVERFRLLGDFLSERIGRPVRFTMLSRYGNIVERIVNKEVDAAFLGSFTGALASAQLGMIPVARPINLDGSSTYWGYIFVRADGGIETVEQMRGRRLALVEKATTAGYVFPVAWLRTQGVDDVEAYFSEVQFWGSHDAAIHAVLDGKADIGAAKNTIWEHLVRQNPSIESELQILATSVKVPSNGLLISADVDAALRDQVRSILVGLREQPSGRPVLEALGAQGFVPTDKDDYQPVFDLAGEAGIDPASYVYRNE